MRSGPHGVSARRSETSRRDPAPRYESSIRTKSFIEPRICRLSVFPITASTIAARSDSTAAPPMPSPTSICPTASRRCGTSKFPSRAGTRTGSSVRSLTQRTSCGRVKRRCAYQSPSFVEGGVDGASSVAPSRFRSFALHRRVNMPIPLRLRRYVLGTVLGTRHPVWCHEHEPGERVESPIAARQCRESGS